ncbi:MAG: hypothetical protein KZQ78_09765 [Candidatus Thiodiazotropha sp. (ex Ustalcina ferruginea)]|nr:hypothetical protein [Candidatus Thiodiazotropha sp. (ex Ustalcina ferruginea)]
MERVLLAAILFVTGCSEPVDVELFNYQACRKQMTEELLIKESPQWLRT